MVLGVTIARKGTQQEVVVGPAVSFNLQRREFHKLAAELTGTYDELQLWSSAMGCVKRRKLKVGIPVTPEVDETSVPENKNQNKDLL